jgi:hypothetical protein
MKLVTDRYCTIEKTLVPNQEHGVTWHKRGECNTCQARGMVYVQCHAKGYGVRGEIQMIPESVNKK